MEDYHNITPQERVEKIARIITKGIYVIALKEGCFNDVIKPIVRNEIQIKKEKSKERLKIEHKKNIGDRILTANEAMELLKISRTTFWRIRKQCEIPYSMIGKRLIRFRLSDILDHLEKQILKHN